MCSKENGLPYGVIFDMDGVLVDSEKFICQAAIAMFHERSLEVQPEDFKDFVGAGENRYIGGVAEKYGYEIEIFEAKKRTYDIYLDMIRGKLKALSGAAEFVSKCKNAGKKIAVASSADQRKVTGNLLETGLTDIGFDTVVHGEQVEHKKPSPDIFLLAAERLGLDARDCLVIEDAVSGVRAAKAAGARCLAITSSFTEAELCKADFFAKDLTEVPTEAFTWQQ